MIALRRFSAISLAFLLTLVTALPVSAGSIINSTSPILTQSCTTANTIPRLTTASTSAAVLDCSPLTSDGTDVTVASASQLLWSTDLILARAAAANLRMGAAAANPPVAQTLSMQNASGTDIAGANFTLDASQGTGTGAGGSVIIRTAAAGGAGSGLNALAAALTIDSTKLATFGGNIALAGNSITGTDNTPDLFAATARGQSAYLGTGLLVNTTAATALHADVTGLTGTPPLAAVSNAANTYTAAFVTNAANAFPGALGFFKTRSATGSDADTAVASGDDIAAIRAYAADGAAYRETSRILQEVQTYTGSDDVSGRMIFYTRPTGAAGALTAALTLDQAQNATFGGNVTTAAPAGGTAATWRLGTVAVISPTAQNRTIEIEVGGTTYYLSAKTTND